MAVPKSKCSADLIILRMKPRGSSHTDLTEKNAEDFFWEIKAGYDRNFRRILVDLSTISSIHIAAVNAFLNQKNKWPGIDLRFYCPEGPVYDFLVDTRFAKVFTVFTDEDDAKKSFAQ